MAIKVMLPTAFTRHTDGRKQFDSVAENLPALIADIEQTFPALGTQIKDDDGKFRTIGHARTWKSAQHRQFGTCYFVAFDS